MSRAAGAGPGLALLLALSACGGEPEQANRSAILTTNEALPTIAAEPVETAPAGKDVVVAPRAGASLTAGATPMAQRVAVVGLLNKRNGQSRDLTLRPGQAMRIGEVIVRLRACERTAPWEQEQYTGAFVQLDVQQTDESWRRVFSGWIYKERPSLNVVQHPIYDVWPKSCTMSFPGAGPDTVAAPSSGASRRSSADQSPSTDAAPSESPADEGPSASESNAT